MGLSFAADWLALREPVDHGARAPAVTAAAIAHLTARRRPLVVDLGCGRGSNVRFLAPHLPADSRWRLIDQDADLLGEAAAALPSWTAETRLLDLRAGDLAAALDGADLVTAAALIDLVSDRWLEALVHAAARAQAALLVTGSVDGRVAWSPTLAADAEVLAAYARHQAGDKGFGAALGTGAPAVLADRLETAGWTVVAARGDWDRVADPGLQAAYLEGVVAALATTDLERALLGRWSRARAAAIAEGGSRLTVGHVDLFARPPGA